ncbi:uncharacterized protein LOC121405118 [Drosophila obscura]|uniref:uncharacterized protein LOC121405118 n=1 Tax=Drosophila obscura TaxID=7282 RepID=UPI001BB196B8|nr:uncharacterized protein LOC121405118 [Drosophila obscura]
MAPQQPTRTQRRSTEGQAHDSRRTRGTMSYRCRVCRGVHPLRKCGRFLRLSAEKRLRAALINQYCPNCLAHEHSGRDCRSGDRCRHCHKHHHTLLHIPDTNRRRPTSVTPSSPAGPRAPTTTSSASRRPRTRDTATDRRPTPPRTSASSSSRPPTLTTLLQHRNPQVLPTASVTVDNGTTTYETRALIDPCRPMSAINASRAKAFHLRTSRIGDEEACAAVLRSPMSPDFQLEVEQIQSPNVGRRQLSLPGHCGSHSGSGRVW